MIFKLEYKNKDLDVARLEITTPGLVEKTIEGTEDPFRLIYKLDKSDKSGHFLTSSAEINIYETEEFNIDALKTSNETEIKVDYYINNVKKWTGFVIPDFFSKEIGKRSVVSMVASDRIGTLKGVTLTDLNAFVSLRTLAEQCLLKTGLSLPLNTMVDLEADAVNFFNVDALSQRLVDNKGRSISCYDILSSILVASDSIILQRNAEWYIVNKLQHELGQGKLYSDSTTFTNWQDIIHNFSDVNVGARRTIIPVAASTGVYHEHGGGRKYPDNYNFADGLAGWTAKNGFAASIDNKKIDFYLFGAPSFSATETVPPYLLNNNQRILSGNSMDLVPYIESSPIAVKAVEADRVKVNIDISVTAPGGASHLTDPAAYPSFVRYAVIATNGPTKLALNRSGAFETYNPNSYETQTLLTHVRNTLDRASFADDISSAVSGTLIAGNDIANYNITIRIYGSGTYQTVLINQATITFSTTNSRLPKGTIFKTEQGSNYTKEHEIDTSIWGDYMTGGLNGYFYNYSIDDTSSLYSNGVLTSKWTDITDPGVERSLLHHITTQRSRMFSQAHDLVSAEMDIRLFDPLSVYVACSKRYTLVSATVDFLRGRANLEIEEAVYQNLTKRDFIYSYFGDGETGVKSIGGISAGAGGGGGTGGGLTPEQIEILSWWKKDPANPNTIFTEMNAYSMGELSAYGIGSGGGGGTDYNRLDAWADYDSTKSGWVLSALLGVDLNTRVGNLDGGSALTVNTTGTGNAITSISKAGTVITATKGLTFSLDGHTHAYLPLSGGTMANTNLVTNLNADLLDGYHSNRFALQGAPAILTDFLVWDGATLFGLRTWAPSTPNYPGDPYGTALDFKDETTWYHRLAFGTSGRIRYYSGINTTTLTKRGDLAFTTDNVSSATKLQAARTIAGVSFDGTANIAIPFANLSSKPTTLAGYGITDAVTINTAQTITGAKTFDANITLGVNRYISGTDNYTGVWNVDNKLWRFGSSSSGSVSNIRSEKVGVGTDSPSEKLHVVGNILATGTTTTTKVIFNAAGWSMEQVGSELQMKHNNLIAARFLSDGSIVGLGEITAYGASTGGEGVSLLRTGGTMTGNLTMSADIIMNSGRAIGVSNLPLKLLGNALTYNASNVLTEANTATQIKMGNGWTIEQTTSALTIKKNGVVKGTFNA